MLDTSKILTKVTYKNTTFTMKGTGGSPKFAELVEGSITSIDASDLSDVTIIRDGAFEGLGLVSAEIPNNVTNIGDNAFAGCSSLQSLSLGDGIQGIGDNAFAGCSSLQSLSLGDGIQGIGDNAFAGIAIEELTLPASLTEIGDNAFADSSLSKIHTTTSTPATIGTNAFGSNVSEIYVLYGAYDNYVSSWSAYANKIVRLPAIPSTITVTVNNYLGELVSGASVTITGNGQTYTGTTDSAGVFSQGDLQPATYTISVADLDGFKTPVSQEVVVEEDTQNSVVVTYLEKPLFAPVYGVSWVNDETTTMTRTDDSVNMTYSINTSTGKIASDFDNVFPYNQMKRQVINGNTFVYVPAMWFRVVADADKKITSIAVSETQGEGNNWYQTRPFYYGAYGASSDGKVLKSVSGVSRLSNITRATARQRAMAVGTGYHQRDLYAGTILMFLWWIEFATKNSQNIMTGFTTKVKNTGGTDNLYNEQQGNLFCVSGYDTSTKQIVWHGIEDYFGNLREWEDGITAYGGKGGMQYVSDDYTLYDDYAGGSKMSPLSFNTYQDGWCLESLGWDETKPFLCQPVSCTRDSTYSSGFCDSVSADGVTVARGAHYFDYVSYGVSCFERDSAILQNDMIGCRLVLRA